MALFAALFFLTPTAQRLDNRYGLGILYALRGPIPPPEDVVVIALDRRTINWLRGLEDSPSGDGERLRSCMPASAYGDLGKIRGPRSLPRSVYGCLVKELTRLGYPAVAFDVLFSVQGNAADDAVLAAAIEEHGAIVLLVGLERSTFEEHQVQPIGAFAEHAAGTGAFIVSRTDGPAYGYWRRFPGFEEMQSLPDKTHQLLGASAANRSVGAIDAAMFEYFWLYGAPGSIDTISLRDILTGEISEEYRDAARTSAAFVGASDRDMTNFADTFSTFIDSGNGANMSGVELAATAFLNLSADQRLWRLSPAAELMVTMSFAFLLGFLVRLRSRFALLVPPSAAVVYIVTAAFAFSNARLFLPVITSVFVVAPTAFVLAGLLRYRFARTLLMRLAPAPVARRMLARATDERMESVSDEATTMFIDLAGSTAIGEKMAPAAFGKLVNDYFDMVKTAAEKYRGLIVAFAGDGVTLSFTKSDAGADHAECACRTAINVVRGIRAINAANGSDGLPPLRIRIGINSGHVAAADIGARDRYNFSVVGDVVNLASRLEQMGKTLFPDDNDVILVGEATHGLANARDLPFVDCGVQQIRGRERPVHVYRIAID